MSQPGKMFFRLDTPRIPEFVFKDVSQRLTFSSIIVYMRMFHIFPQAPCTCIGYGGYGMPRVPGLLCNILQ